MRSRYGNYRGRGGAGDREESSSSAKKYNCGVKSKQKKHAVTFDIDRFGRVGLNGGEVCITTPLVRIPFGVEKYNNNYVINLELINSAEEDEATAKFVKQFNKYERELERQLEGNFVSSLRAGSSAGAKVRTRAMTESKGTITSEIEFDGRELGILEIERGDVGTFRLKLAKAWTMTDRITGRDSAGGVWVIESGTLTEHAGSEGREAPSSFSRSKDNSKKGKRYGKFRGSEHRRD